jgi:hypothetical protein
MTYLRRIELKMANARQKRSIEEVMNDMRLLHYVLSVNYMDTDKRRPKTKIYLLDFTGRESLTGLQPAWPTARCVIYPQDLERVVFDPVWYDIASTRNNKLFCAGNTASTADSWLVF